MITISQQTDYELELLLNDTLSLFYSYVYELVTQGITFNFHQFTN